MHNRFYQASGLQALWAWGANVVNVKGRSSRCEYWWVWLFGDLASMLSSVGLLGIGADRLRQVPMIAYALVLVVILVPSATLQIRRLRDAGIDLRQGIAVMLIEVGAAIVFLTMRGLIGQLALVALLASGGGLLWWSAKPSMK